MQVFIMYDPSPRIVPKKLFPERILAGCVSTDPAPDQAGGGIFGAGGGGILLAGPDKKCEEEQEG